MILKILKKLKKFFVIVLKINGKCDKLNKLLNKRIFRFYCCYQFYKGFISKKSFWIGKIGIDRKNVLERREWISWKRN